jgi:hypothetical protein
VSFEFITVSTFIIAYGFIYANGRFREPLMPLLILWVCKNKPWKGEEWKMKVDCKGCPFLYKDMGE